MLETLRFRLSRFQNLQKVFENTAWLFADKVIRALVAFLIGAAFARVLGPSRYGVYNYAFAVVVILSPFVTLGIDEILIRDLIQKPQLQSSLLGSALAMKVMGAFVLFIGVAAYGLTFHSHDPLTLALLAIFGAGTLGRCLEVGDVWFQSQIESRSVVFPRMIALVIFTGLKVLVLFSAHPIIYFAGLWGLEIFFGGLLTLFFYRLKVGALRGWKVDPSMMRQLFIQGAPLMISTFLISLHMRLDQILLKWMADDYVLGVYSGAVKLIEIWYFVPLVLASGLFPSVVKSKAVSTREYEQRVQALYDLLIWMALLFAIAMQFLSPWVIHIVLGSRFEESAPILAIYSWVGLSIFFMQARLRWLAIEGQLKGMLWVEGATVIANAGLNLFLIPKYGVVGAAWTAILSALAGNLSVAAFSAPIRKSLRMYLRSLALPYRLLVSAGKVA